MADKPINTTPATTIESTKDFRVRQARQTIERTAAGYDDYGTAVAQLLEARQEDRPTEFPQKGVSVLRSRPRKRA
jgi:hypothetical protein